MSHLPETIRALFTPPSSPPSESARKLARILKIPAGELYTVRLGRRYHYRPFSIAKRDGRERRILAPSPALKELQRRLLRRYLQHLPVHPAATAFTPGSSIAHNARLHAGQALIATADLADFYESTSARRVRAFYLRQGWRGEALSTLMRLCVYRNGLPQGAPTSPSLSNLVNVDLDEALTEWARRAGAIYTRYGDDLTFSWRTGRIPASFDAVVRHCALNAGYQIQPRKGWHVYRAAEEPEITGLILGRDGRVRAPQRIHRQMRKLRWRAWRHRLLRWLPGHSRSQERETLERLRGYEGFLNDPGLK